MEGNCGCVLEAREKKCGRSTERYAAKVIPGAGSCKIGKDVRNNVRLAIMAFAHVFLLENQLSKNEFRDSDIQNDQCIVNADAYGNSPAMKSMCVGFPGFC